MATSISGIVSDLDWQGLIDDLIDVASAPIDIQNDKKDSLQDEYDEWSTVISLLGSLETSVNALSSADDFDLYTSNSTMTGSSSSVEDLLTVAVGSTATEGSYSITINQLATAQKQASEGFSSSTEALGISGDVTINGQVVSIEESDSLSDIQTMINNLNSGDDSTDVTASIIAISDSEYRLILTSDNTGADGMSITDGTGSLGLTEIVAGQDAQITVDGFSVTQSTNTISDVISGVTLKLTGEDEDATITLNIERDTESVKGLIEDFVDAYNAVMDEIAAQSTVTTTESDDDEDETTTEPLFGDSTLRNVKSTLRSTVISSVEGLDSTLNTLSLIGITTDSDGHLSIDDDTLDEYLETNFDDVMNLFAAQVSSSDSSLNLVREGDSMAAGDYEVEITQVATQANVSGSGFSGSLSADATVTITDSYDNEAVITLSAGSDMSAIVDAINSELDSSGLAVSASMDENGQLVLSNDDYGDASFTVSTSGGDLGVTDGTYTGTDVEGQIRLSGSDTWMSMTGNGQTLTGDDDTDVDGLVIKYTGADTGSYSLTYTKGIGQSLSEALEGMIDSRDGYVVGQQESVQNHIDRVNDYIDKLETRLNKYYETLYNKYVAMETMISSLQSQSSWLSSMISSLSTSSS